ncbi:MAG TPA: hypothetical protein VIN03_16655 [Roseateles sp.]
MIQPIGNRVFVKLDETIPTGIDGLVIPPDVNRWRGQGGAVDSYNRGTVAYVGPDADGLAVGDVVRFSEIAYPTTKVDGVEFVVITDMDVVGVEEEGSYSCHS